MSLCELCCLFPSLPAMVELSQSVRGYRLATFIEIWMHLITVLLAIVDIAELSQGLCGLKHQPTI